MGMFGSTAKQSELKNLLKWLTDHGEIENGKFIIDYEKLVKEIEARIKYADYD